MSVPLTLSLLAEHFAVVRLPADSFFPAWVNHSEATFWSITHTPEEWSIVCDQDSVPPACDAVERGWRAFKLHGPIGFSVTGVIAGITAALSAAGIPVFVQSTYDTDYVLVKDENVAHAVEVLGGRYVVRPD
ncbi:MAG: ACT domain-containing protein [Candidatus Eisenbacteria bacterium]